MRLNQATDYAFRIIMELSLMEENQRMTGAELAERQQVPIRFLLKIMRSLLQAGLVKSYRGISGGFVLNKSPKDITLYDVIRTMEPENFFQRCLTEPNLCTKHAEGNCAVRHFLMGIAENLQAELTRVNFAEIAEQERRLHQKR